MPIPDRYNKFKFQIRISPTSSIQEENDQLNLHNNESFRTKKNSSLIIEHGMPLETITSNGRDVNDFQTLCKTWSDLIVVNSLKLKLPLNKTTFLKHGRTYTIIKKEATLFPNSFDITLRPPLLLKNCLPVPLSLEFEDSNGLYNSINLDKQEERHIFGFNLQKPIDLRLTIQGFQP